MEEPMSKYGILAFVAALVSATSTAFAYESFSVNAGSYTYTYSCQNSCVVGGGSVRDSGGGLVSVARTRREIIYNQ
jgi:hypothetical protein